MGKTDLVDAAAEGWLATLVMFAATQPGGSHRRGDHGTCAVVTTAPAPAMNAVFAVGPEADPAEIAEFAASFASSPLPWSIKVRSDRFDDRIAVTAAEHGLGQRTTQPFMLKDLTAADAELPESAAHVRSLSGEESALYQSSLAAGFEAPAEFFERLAAPAIMNHPAMRAYLVETEDGPVATAFGVLVGELVGVYNISVSPEHRRQGYGRLATAAVLRDAHAAGAHTAFLGSSEIGLPLYEEMGFRIAENWTIFHA
ncbi:GNAT family N-acetyltransferase [Thermopolyspora sp. NPDC052614]|uniref:GNAT family N-acetyltransferase n=1 Tax=Thermopolyspora sp. NPDC052614 TaxID=3155682 RepID=UPI00342FB7F8